MKVLVTGGQGFVGKNLVARLREHEAVETVTFTKGCGLTQLRTHIAAADIVFHLAGVNRSAELSDFTQGNADLTRTLAELVAECGRPLPIVFTSSVQAQLDNPYGLSKRSAEQSLLSILGDRASPVYIYRLPNVFGKWSRPNYNSVVATFCYNIARELPIAVNNSAVSLSLVYIDDLIDEFTRVLAHHSGDSPRALPGPFREVTPIHSTTVGELAEKILEFKNSRASQTIDHVGRGFLRALYSTYLSFLPPELFAYSIPKHVDDRGEFAEVLKTLDSGQFSYFTAHPGATRGGHYHQTKNEKFLVIRGHARFRFRHILTGDTAEMETSGEHPKIVETVPGWTHDITNIGKTELIVMLWANEIFDQSRPDTFPCKV